MAFKTDMSKAKKKWEEERARAAAQQRFGRPVLWWKAKVGTNKIRILPPWTDEGPNALQWWRELWQHYGLMASENPDPDNAFSASCAAKTPDAPFFLGVDPTEKIQCKFCAHTSALRSSGDPANLELAKQVRSKMRVLANILDLDDPVYTKKDIEQLKAKGCPDKSLPEAGKPKIQVYAFGPTIMQDILDFYQDNVDLADLDAGHDITIEREGSDRNTKYRVRPSLTPSKAQHITDDDLTDMWNLDQLMPFFTEQQQDLVLAGASKEEVYALTAGSAAPEERQLTTGKGKKKDEEEESTGEEEESSTSDEESGESEEETPAEEEAAEEEAAAEDGDTPEWPPLDSDSNIDYEQLTDEQIEDAQYAETKDKDGFSVHVGCFGTARQRNPKDKDCFENCGLFERCGKRIAALDAEEAAKKAAAAKKATPPKKAPGKPAPAPAPAAKEEPPKKKAPGKPAAPAAKEEKPAGGATSLEEEMKRALGKK